MKQLINKGISAQLAAALAGLLCTMAASCAGSAGEDISGHAAVLPLDPATQQQEQVSAELMQILSAELERVMLEEGRTKGTSAAPVGPGSVVANFAAYLDGLQQRVYFSYRNQGDYDANGIVTIADLTPVGVHFGKSSQSPDWLLAQSADGDGNGLITIADVTPIGQNFGGRIDGYELQLAQPVEFEEIESFALESFAEAASGQPYLDADFVAAGAGRLRVVPFSSESGARQYGPPSNIENVPLLLSPAKGYPQYRGNAGRSGQTTVDFPEGVEFNWGLPIEGSFSSSRIVVDRHGNSYIGSGTYSDPEDQPLDGFMHGISLQGELMWRVQTHSPVTTAGAITQRGDIVVGLADGRVISFSSDGRINWVYESGLRLIESSSPLLRQDESLVMSGLNLETSQYEVFCLDAEGSLQWDFIAADPISGAGSVLNNEGMLGFGQPNDSLLYLTADGLGMPSPLLAGLTTCKAMIRAGDRVLMTSFSGLFYSLEPPAALEISYDAIGDMPGDAAYDGTNEIFFHGASLGDGTGSLTAMSPSLVWFWDKEFDSRVAGSILVDQDGDVLVPVNDDDGSGATGIWCVGSDQSTKWFYDTEGSFPGTPVAGADGVVLFSMSDKETFDSQIVAIGNVL